jgi:CRP/FNR family transcriptional regulator, cyclic AMP receptor protein
MHGKAACHCLSKRPDIPSCPVHRAKSNPDTRWLHSKYTAKAIMLTQLDAGNSVGLLRGMKEYAPVEDVNSIMSILSKISFFGGLSDTQRNKVLRFMKVGHFRKGEYVSKRGEEPSHIYVIIKGKIDLLITDNHVSIRKREFNVGNCFGEAAMLAMNNNTATFVAAEDSELIVLSKRALNQLRREDLNLFCILIMNLARELARKLQFTDEILLKHEHERGVAAALDEIGARSQGSSAVETVRPAFQDRAASTLQA